MQFDVHMQHVISDGTLKMWEPQMQDSKMWHHWPTCTEMQRENKSSAVAEMGDRGHNRYGPKRGGGATVPLSPIAANQSNTKWPGPRSTSVPSGVLIHPAIWPQ